MQILFVTQNIYEHLTCYFFVQISCLNIINRLIKITNLLDQMEYPLKAGRELNLNGINMKGQGLFEVTRESRSLSILDLGE